jgi:glutamate dehydrogenase/leucine dehydrogenase
VALQLHERGARVIAVSDIEGAVTNPDGLDVAKLIDFQHERPLNQFPGGMPMIRDELPGVDCDTAAPAFPDIAERLRVAAAYRRTF